MDDDYEGEIDRAFKLAGGTRNRKTGQRSLKSIEF